MRVIISLVLIPLLGIEKDKWEEKGVERGRNGVVVTGWEEWGL